MYFEDSIPLRKVPRRMRFIDWTPVGFVDNAEFESKHPRKSNGQFGKGGATGVEGLASIETVRRRIRLNESWGPGPKKEREYQDLYGRIARELEKENEVRKEGSPELVLKYLPWRDRRRLIQDVIDTHTLSDDETLALHAYSGRMYFSINNGLRNGFKENSQAKRLAELLDQVANKCTLKESITVYRGVDNVSRVLSGDHYFDAAFASTSVNIARALSFGDNILIMTLPKGLHVIPEMRFSELPQQEEALLIRGVRGSIIRTTEAQDIKYQGKSRHLKLYFIKIMDQEMDFKDEANGSDEDDLPFEKYDENGKETTYLNWDGEKTPFYAISRISYGEQPITFEALKKSFAWAMVDDKERERLAKYWEHPEKYDSWIA